MVTQIVRLATSGQSLIVSPFGPTIDRLRLIVVRADEAHLGVALGVVAHGRDGEVDLVVGEQRDAAGGIDPREHRLDAEMPGQLARHVDIVARPDIALARAEQRIVFAHADAELAVAEDAHQPVEAGLRAGAWRRGGGLRLVDQLRQRRIGRLGARGEAREGDEPRQGNKQNAPHRHVSRASRPRRSRRCACRQRHAGRSDGSTGPLPLAGSTASSGRSSRWRHGPAPSSRYASQARADEGSGANARRRRRRCA